MWPNPQETADLATFTEAVLKGKLHFLWVLIFCKISKNHWTVTSLSYEKAWCMGKNDRKKMIWFMIFISRYKDNSNTICLKYFWQIHILKKSICRRTTLRRSLDIFQNGFFDPNWSQSCRFYHNTFSVRSRCILLSKPLPKSKSSRNLKKAGILRLWNAFTKY